MAKKHPKMAQKWLVTGTGDANRSGYLTLMELDEI